MKKKLLMFVFVLTLTLCSGCGKSEGTQNQDTNEGEISEKDAEGELSGEDNSSEDNLEERLMREGESQKKIIEAEEQEGEKAKAQETEQQPSTEPEHEFGLEDLTDCVFSFSSGVGAWSTELRIDADGTFRGHYQDADMGDAGENYPDGTLYVCDFTGKFGALEKVDDFTYKMKLESLAFEQQPEKEEIVDGVRNVYSTAYGIDGGEDFYLYLPDAEFSSLPESFRGWVNNFWAWVNDPAPDGSMEGKLSFYGLYNEKMEEGFSSYEYKEESLSERIAMEISIAEDLEADWETRQDDSATQLEMNMASAELYQIWDDTLNTVWKLLEAELDEATMEQLRAEEREWINFKEAEAKAAGKEMEGGSMQPMLESGKAAELTKERVYELAKYAE